MRIIPDQKKITVILLLVALLGITSPNQAHAARDIFVIVDDFLDLAVYKCSRTVGCICSLIKLSRHSGRTVKINPSYRFDELAAALTSPDFREKFVLQPNLLPYATPRDSELSKPNWAHEIIWPCDDRVEVVTLNSTTHPVKLVFVGDGSQRIGIVYPINLVTGPKYIRIDGEIRDRHLRAKLWEWKQANDDWILDIGK